MYDGAGLHGPAATLKERTALVTGGGGGSAGPWPRAWQAAGAAVTAQVPLGRIGSAAEVAGAVVFLCGDEARYITGEILEVKGGLRMD